MTPLIILGDSLPRAVQPGPLAVAEESFGDVLMMLAIFAALVVLIELMMKRRKMRPDDMRPMGADPFQQGRRDDLVETNVPSNFQR